MCNGLILRDIFHCAIKAWPLQVAKGSPPCVESTRLKPLRGEPSCVLSTEKRERPG
jgi:hypothetical protein